MSDIIHIIETGVKLINESLDINDKYFPEAASSVSRLILTTIVRTTAQQAYEAGLMDGGHGEE